MTRYQALLARLSASTQRDVGVLWARHTRGNLSRPQFVALAAARIAAADRRAATLADAALVAQLMAALREPVAPLGLEAANADQARLAGALVTVIDAPVQAEGEALDLSVRSRVERLAGNEPLVTAAVAMREGMTLRSDVVRGWTRSTSPGACELCTGWSSGGPFPPQAVMARHPGCTCVQQILIHT